jgi:sugar phosphate isomerase/epimerase
MRLAHRCGRTVHLSHRANPRPASDLPGIIKQLDTYGSAVRARLGVDTLGVSLWLPPALAASLALDARARARFRAELASRGLEVVTLSGVRYGAGEPDWSSPARLDYTLDLARILVDLLPDDMVRGAVSTLGFGRRDGWDAGKDRSATRLLGRLASGLAEVAWHTGRAVRVGFQPEPGYVLDTAVNTVAALATVDRERLGVCLDLASLACTWENPAHALDTLADNGVSVIQVQVTAALEAARPGIAAGALRGYAGMNARSPVTNPAGAYVDDLARALEGGPPGPWRIRHRVPMHAVPPPPLAATTDVASAALSHLLGGSYPATEYLDVDPEDWGWSGLTEPASDGAAELAHVIGELSGIGVTPALDACAL